MNGLLKFSGPDHLLNLLSRMLLYMQEFRFIQILSGDLTTVFRHKQICIIIGYGRIRRHRKKVFPVIRFVAGLF